MDNNSDCNAVPSLNDVVEEIFSSCDKQGKDEVSASTLIEFMKPHMSNHLIGLTRLLYILDPNNENPYINKTTFYEALRNWTAKMNESDSELLNFSFKDTDVFDENGVLFHQSTPKPSLEPTTMNHSNNSLDFSNLSPTSFTADTKENSTGMDKLLFIEERYQELEHKHLNTLRELSLLKSQLVSSEEQYAELKQDLDRTNKRLMLEQQVNADLQKSMEHNDDFKEEVCTTKKEKEHLHRMWLLTKRENVNLIEQLKNLEYERELLERKMNEMQRKDEQKKKEFVDLQTLFSLYEDENKLLKKSKVELEEKLEETKASLEHYTEVSEILKNKIQALTTAYKRKGVELNDLNPEKDPSHLSHTPGTPINSPIQPQLTSSTPLKNLQHLWHPEFDVFTSPKLLRQISSPITPGGLDTPQFVKTTLFSKTPENTQNNSTSLGRIQMLKGALHPNRVLATKSGRSKNLPPVRLSGELTDKEKRRCFSEKAETSSQSEHSLFETIEDLDLSSFSDNLLMSNGQDLLSELQECKFLDNHNKCYIEEHADLLKIVKEHENCSQIIADKGKQIKSILSKMKTSENEYKSLLNKYETEKKSNRCLEEHLKKTKLENAELLEISSKNASELENFKKELDSKNTELQKVIILEARNSQLIKDIHELKEKIEENVENYDEMKKAKENLESIIDDLMKEKDDILNQKNNLFIENKSLNAIIEIKGKELIEMENLKIKNEELENEVDVLSLNQEKNCKEIEKLSDKLKVCRKNGKSFVEKLNMKIQEQNAKFEFLRDFNKKLQEYVDELQAMIEAEKKKLQMLISYVEENFVNVKYVPKNDDEDSTSTGSNESSSQHRSKRGSNTGRKSNFDKQQFRINKLEEKIEELEKEIQNEKAINESLKGLNYKINDLEMEKINYEEEKRSILRELEATKYDLSMKTQMMKQFEEKHKFDLDNLNRSYEKEMELTKVAQIEAHNKAELLEMSLTEQIEELKKHLIDSQREKKLFEVMLEKRENKIIYLKKALSDISTSTEETKNFEILVSEKESMLKFNRELLLKSNNSLKEVENRCLFLELLLDKCRMVLLDTVNDVLRSTIDVFNSHRNTLEKKRVDPKLIHELEILETEKPAVEDFTEKEIWKAHNQLTITSKLLKALVLGKEEYNGCSCGKDLPSSKSVSKFTLRPQIQLHRLPSCDPDISSSSMKENESVQNIQYQESPEIGKILEKKELKENTNEGSIVNLSENDSVTNWLGPYIADLSVQLTEDSHNSPDNCKATIDLGKSFRSVGVGDSNFDSEKNIEITSPPAETKTRRCSSFFMTTSTIMCLLVMCILFIHIECIRNGNETIMCPLDVFVSIKKAHSESFTY